MTTKKVTGLGRGLQSLIPTKKVEITPKTKGDNIYYVEVHNVRPNPEQPRKDFDVDALKDLAFSIKKYGVLQPLLVQKVEDETNKGIRVAYEVIAGERRLRAAKLAGLQHVPVIIKDEYNKSRIKLELALIENLQREDLNAMEEAEAFDRLMDEFALAQREVAARIGKSREYVANSVRLLNLPQNVQDAVRMGKVASTAARALLQLKTDEERQAMFQQMLAGKVNQKDIEHQARITNPSDRIPREINENARFYDLQENLSKRLETIVFIKSHFRGDSGKIEIKFASLEELNTIAKSILD